LKQSQDYVFLIKSFIHFQENDSRTFGFSFQPKLQLTAQ
jgi:hypothetical protein